MDRAILTSTASVVMSPWIILIISQTPFGFLDRIYRINRIWGTVDMVFVFVYGHGRPDNLVAKFINTHNLVNPVNPV